MIYLVSGRTGEYSNSREWIVGSFSKRDDAEALVLKLNDWLRENKLYVGECTADWLARTRVTCPLDDKFDVDYTGTAYEVVDVSLDDAKLLEAIHA